MTKRMGNEGTKSPKSKPQAIDESHHGLKRFGPQGYTEQLFLRKRQEKSIRTEIVLYKKKSIK